MSKLRKIATHGQKWICNDCEAFLFSIFRSLGKGNRKPLCPVCGESYGVEKFVPMTPEEGVKSHIRFTDEEKEVMKECLKGTMSVAQASILLGRSTHSITKKLQRMRGKKG